MDIKMRLGKILLSLGFIISFLTNLLIATYIFALLALYTYGATVSLRGLGWLLLRRFTKVNILTGIVVLILGWAFLLLGLSTGRAILTLWVLYSLVEAYSYIKMSRVEKLYRYAAISIVSIFIGLMIIIGEMGWLSGLPVDLDNGDTYPIPIYIMLFINMASAIIASIASINIDKASLEAL